MNYSLTVECRSCQNEQEMVVSLPAAYNDTDLAQAIEASPLTCTVCGDRNFGPFGEPELVP